MSYSSFEVIKDNIVSISNYNLEINSIINKNHISNDFCEDFVDFDDEISQVINFNSPEIIYSIFDNNIYYINFLDINSLPEKCFFINCEQKIKCYICIIDMSPYESINKISEKFYSGYLQCKAFFDAIDENDIEYNYYIFGYKKMVEKKVAGFPIFNGVTKILPGNNPNDYVITFDEFKINENYKSNEILYFINNNETSDFKRSISFPFRFVQFDKVNSDSKMTASLSIP